MNYGEGNVTLKVTDLCHSPDLMISYSRLVLGVNFDIHPHNQPGETKFDMIFKVKYQVLSASAVKPSCRELILTCTSYNLPMGIKCDLDLLDHGHG